MSLPTAHQRFRDALTEAGWIIEQDQPWTRPGAANPSRLVIRRSRLQRHLFVYAWEVTPEGKGRKKAGRDDLDWRVQTTRSHEGDMYSPPGHLAVGLGWHTEQEVFAAFDVWIKRTTGTSSSVHLTRQLLNAGQADGWSEETGKGGPTCAFTANNVNRYLAWLSDRDANRVVAIDPVSHHLDGDRLTVRLEPRKDWRYFSVRIGDHIVLRRKGSLLDRSLWVVDALETDRQQTEGGRNKPFLDLSARRRGVVRSDSFLDVEAS